VDAAGISWRAGDKKPKTRQLQSPAGTGALGGAFWGFLFGLIFFVPVLGPAIGAGPEVVAEREQALADLQPVVELRTAVARRCRGRFAATASARTHPLKHT
jgi:hypothetical protein